MKDSTFKIGFVVIAAVLCVCTMTSVAQTLPMKDAIAVGGSLTFPAGKGTNDFTDVHGSTLCFSADLNYRHYLSDVAALGAIYQFCGSHHDRDLLRCHYIAPTLTCRALQNEGSQSLYFTFGMGFLLYSDRIYSRPAANHTFNQGYFAASLSLGYECTFSNRLSSQLHIDFLTAKWSENENYQPSWQRDNPNEYESMFEPKRMFASVGLDIQFALGKPDNP
jgi:hypothetical protein